jgi:hypothetical protein
MNNESDHIRNTIAVDSTTAESQSTPTMTTTTLRGIVPDALMRTHSNKTHLCAVVAEGKDYSLTEKLGRSADETRGLLEKQFSV